MIKIQMTEYAIWSMIESVYGFHHYRGPPTLMPDTIKYSRDQAKGPKGPCIGQVQA
jgi:hypothetical protein